MFFIHGNDDTPAVNKLKRCIDFELENVYHFPCHANVNRGMVASPSLTNLLLVT